MKTLIVTAYALVACGSSPLDAASTAGGASGSGASAGASSAAGGPAFVERCSAARAQLLGAVPTVSTGNVEVLSDSRGVKTLYVDASAGGQNGAATHPWTFVSLANGMKVQVTDVTSLQSLAWDLAFKRAQIYSNGGEGGPGAGASTFLDRDFADVTRADLASADFSSETFFDEDCNPIVDITGAVSTSFSSWYSYDEARHVLNPAAGTWLIRVANGEFFKLRFKGYYTTPSGEMGPTAGGYLLEVGAL